MGRTVRAAAAPGTPGPAPAFAVGSATSPSPQPRTDPPAVTLSGVGFAYPGATTAALHAIDLTVARGEVLGVVGPSGCGKSTLLRLVAGLLVPGAGTIALDGADATRIRPEARHVGWVPQSYGLFDHLDVAGNVGFGLTARRRPRAEVRRRVSEVVDLCRIGDLAGRRVTDLSGGQRQRVAIARALAPDPRVLLLDEPFAALDPQLRGAIRADLAEVLQVAGTTALMVTHDQREALAMADRVLVLRDGRAVQLATPGQLWDHPFDGFVAELVSAAVVVPGTADARGTTVGAGLRVPSAGTGAVGVCLRPGDLVLAGDGIGATVLSREYAGGSWHLRCLLAGGLVVPVAAAAGPAPEVGEVVTVASAPGVCPPLVPSTGQAVEPTADTQETPR